MLHCRMYHGGKFRAPVSGPWNHACEAAGSRLQGTTCYPLQSINYRSNARRRQAVIWTVPAGPLSYRPRRHRLGSQTAQELFMQGRIAAGQHGTALVARAAGPVRHDTPRALDDRHQRLHVVGLQARSRSRRRRSPSRPACSSSSRRRSAGTAPEPRPRAAPPSPPACGTGADRSSRRSRPRSARRAACGACAAPRRAATATRRRRRRGTSRRRRAGGRRPPPGSMPSCSAIRTPQCSWPRMKLFVPSIGSITHVYFDVPVSRPCSSPWMPWSGYARLIAARITASASRSAAVTGS